jgi:hypothetical protein
MPNWCDNVVEIGHDNPEKLQEAVAAFNAGALCEYAIPVPKELHITAGRVGGNHEYAQQLLELTEALNVKFFGYKNWYDFCVDKWGTKWDVTNEGDAIELTPGQTDDTISFMSAWSPPCGVYDALIEKGFRIRAYYHEPGMAFAGIYTESGDDYYELDDSIEGIREQIPESLDEAFNITGNMEMWEEDEDEDEDEAPDEGSLMSLLGIDTEVLTLDKLKQMFPVTQPRAKRALTGHIPMEFVEQHEAEIKKIVSQHQLRRVYRGPRNRYRSQSRTWKSDAVAMVLY